jgi:hypothetical protein
MSCNEIHHLKLMPQKVQECDETSKESPNMQLWEGQAWVIQEPE